MGREVGGGKGGSEGGVLWGLNFMSEDDAMKFLKGCTVRKCLLEEYSFIFYTYAHNLAATQLYIQMFVWSFSLFSRTATHFHP